MKKLRKKTTREGFTQIPPQIPPNPPKSFPCRVLSVSTPETERQRDAETEETEQYAENLVLVIFFGFFQTFEVYFVGCPAVCLVPFGFRKAREAGSFHVSNFRPNPTAGVRVMTPKPKNWHV